MRALNIFAALSGAVALIMLVIAAHLIGDDAAAVARIKTGGFIQLAAAVAGLAIAGRAGRLNLVAGAIILAGAALFAGTLYAISLTGERSFALLAPVGGFTLILGWLALAFARPKPG